MAFSCRRLRSSAVHEPHWPCRQAGEQAGGSGTRWAPLAPARCVASATQCLPFAPARCVASATQRLPFAPARCVASATQRLPLAPARCVASATQRLLLRSPPTPCTPTARTFPPLPPLLVPASRRLCPCTVPTHTCSALAPSPHLPPAPPAPPTPLPPTHLLRLLAAGDQVVAEACRGGCGVTGKGVSLRVKAGGPGCRRSHAAPRRLPLGESKTAVSVPLAHRLLPPTTTVLNAADRVEACADRASSSMQPANGTAAREPQSNIYSPQ